MLLHNSCRNNSVINGLKKKKKKRMQTALYGKIKERIERQEVNGQLERVQKTCLIFQL